jgi:regulatory protein
VKRTASPITAKYLQNAAVFYLERYASSAEGLRRVLRRRVSKARLLEAPVMDNAEEAIDKAFAQTKARSLHRRGVSGQLTRQRLKVAGVGREDVDSALAALDEELGTDPARREIQAAVAFARRRRLGPFRMKEREEKKARDLASMARAGFAYDLARKVIDATDPDSLDEA